MRAPNEQFRIAVTVPTITFAVLWTATIATPKLPPPPTAQDIALQVDPAQSKVHYSVESTLHTVHGTFALKNGSVVHFDPVTGKASGQVTVYATSGDSGNSSRDERMHNEVLESHKYSDVIFRPAQVEGSVAQSGTSDVKLRGTLILHGAEHEIVATVHANLMGDRWNGTASFQVPYVQWGLKNPSTWLLKVKPVVTVQLEMAGTASAPK